HDGKTLALLETTQAVRLWDVVADRELRPLAAPAQPQPARQPFDGRLVAFSPDGKLLAATGVQAQKVVVRVWEVDGGRERPALTRPSGSLSCLAFSPDGKTLAVGASQLDVALLNLETGAESRRKAMLQGNSQGLAFSPDGKILGLVRGPGFDLT